MGRRMAENLDELGCFTGSETGMSPPNDESFVLAFSIACSSNIFIR